MASKLLVIDACVARAAGPPTATDPTAKNCRDFLEEIRGGSHRVLMSKSIGAEWDKHRSSFSEEWRLSMFERNRIKWVKVPTDLKLRASLSKAAATQAVKNIVLKDCHLIEAAFKADRIVTSIEQSCFKHFREMAETVGKLQKIGWVNPNDPSHKPIQWLREGAPIESCLRFRSTGPGKKG